MLIHVGVAQRFRLGSRYVTASGTPSSHHPNVVFLRVCPTIFSRLISWLLLHLPEIWRDQLESWYPEWFLPSKLIMKREKDNWKEEFENEKNIYQLLRPVQGVFVPKYYGQVECPSTGVRALILSDVGGVPLGKAKGLDPHHLKNMLEQATRAVIQLKVVHDDDTLDNCQLVGGRIMLIDFDASYIIEPEDTTDPEYLAHCAVRFLGDQYRTVHPSRQPGWSIFDYGRTLPPALEGPWAPPGIRQRAQQTTDLPHNPLD